MLIRISLCFILMFGCRRINRKRKIVDASLLVRNYLSFSITLLVAYSNSSLPSCCVVFFVGFDGRNQGVLSDFYLLRGFLRNCIVILLSVTLPLLPLSFIMHPLYILTPSTIYFISLFKCLFSTFHNIDYVIMCFL